MEQKRSTDGKATGTHTNTNTRWPSLILVTASLKIVDKGGGKWRKGEESKRGGMKENHRTGVVEKIRGNETE